MSGQLAIEQYRGCFPSSLRYAFRTMMIHTCRASTASSTILSTSATPHLGVRELIHSYENEIKTIHTYTSKILTLYLEKLRSNDLQYDSCFSINCQNDNFQCERRCNELYFSAILKAKTNLWTQMSWCPYEKDSVQQARYSLRDNNTMHKHISNYIYILL